MMHTRRRILNIKRGMSTFRIIDDIEMTDAPQKMNLTHNISKHALFHFDFRHFAKLLTVSVYAFGLLHIIKVFTTRPIGQFLDWQTPHDKFSNDQNPLL